MVKFTLFSSTEHACVLLEFGLNLSVLGKPSSAFKHRDDRVAVESFDSSLALFDRVYIMTAGARISCWYLSSKFRNMAPDTTVSKERCF